LQLTLCIPRLLNRSGEAAAHGHRATVLTNALSGIGVLNR
jgi:hypothetical protein